MKGIGIAAEFQTMSRKTIQDPGHALALAQDHVLDLNHRTIGTDQRSETAAVHQAATTEIATTEM